MSRRPRRLLPRLVVAAAGAVALWWLLAPVSIGGSMAYLAVRGTSMEPTFAAGDLVVTRSASAYAPGEVVAYRQPGGDSGNRAVVVHRVVAVDGNRLVLRGDANELPDAVRPTEDDVVGRELVVIPGAGRVLAALGSPVVGTLLVVGAVGLGMAAMTRRTTRRRTSTDLVSTPPAPPNPPVDDPVRRLAVWRPGPPWVWGVLAVAVGVAAVLVVRSPATAPTADTTPWTVATSFGWDRPADGDAAVVAVHGDDGVRTGDTLFAGVTPVVAVRVTSTLSSPDPTLSAGAELGVTAHLVSDAGWRRTVAELPAAPLTDGSAVSEVVLDLPAIWAAAATSGAVAGRQGETRLDVVASTVGADGDVEAAAVQSFLLDGVAATPEPPVAAAADGVDPEAGALVGGDGGVVQDAVAAVPQPEAGLDQGTGDGAGVPTGTVAIDGSTSTTRLTVAEITVGPVTLPRNTALAGIAAIGGLVVVGWLVAMAASSRARRRGEASLLVTRHRSELVPLGAPPPDGGQPLEVPTFPSLRRVAEQLGQPIGVSGVGGEAADFWVTDGARSWRYRAPDR